MTYTALVLTDESHEKLISKFVIPEEFEKLAHHMTLYMGNIKEEHQHLLGEYSDLIVHSFSEDDKVMAVAVDSLSVPTVNKIPHITLAVNRTAGGKPVMSNRLTEWKKIEPFRLRGRIEEVG